MSRSIKHEKTTGFLERSGKIRKARQAERELKAQLLNFEFDCDNDTYVTQYAES